MGASAHAERALALADGALAAGALLGGGVLGVGSGLGLLGHGGRWIEGQKGSVDGNEEEVAAAVHGDGGFWGDARRPVFIACHIGRPVLTGHA